MTAVFRTLVDDLVDGDTGETGMPIIFDGLAPYVFLTAHALAGQMGANAKAVQNWRKIQS